MAACLAVEKAKEIAEEKQSVRVSKKKNLVKNGLLVASVAVIIPLIFLTVFAYVIKLPRENVFQTSHELFLENQYSDVATALKPVAINDMPKVVRYELAYSYVKNESLTDGERSNALKRLTLQSNPLYFKYWIQNGRGDESGALDTARSLNDLDLDLTIFALIKEKQAVIENLSMDGKEKEKKLQDIESVLSQYESKLKKNQAAGTNSGAANAQNTQAASSQKDKKASKDQKKRQMIKQRKKRIAVNKYRMPV
ncbi:type VII secretion protein EssB/YukC [Terrilactibacillus sp. S3-3]|nr:type VII secretion protein EssB/YukC [Terrilactibacillus sp. S3-3]